MSKTLKLDNETPIKDQVKAGGWLLVILGVVVVFLLGPVIGGFVILAGGIMVIAGHAATE